MMKTERGFTLIELIITIVLSAILSAIVVEIVAGPIRSYFWVSKQSSFFEIGSQVMESLSQEVPLATVKDLQVENQSLQYRKILYSGLMLSAISSGMVVAPALSDSLKTFQQENALFILFPSDKLRILYPVKLLNENQIAFENNIPNMANSAQMKNIPFLLVSSPMQIAYDSQKKILERISKEINGKVNRVLLGNQIENCQFVLSEAKVSAKTQVLVALTFKNDKQRVKMAHAFFCEETS